MAKWLTWRSDEEMFIGNFEHTLDSKSRVAVPSKLRDSIPSEAERSTFVITRGHEDCLYLFTERGWAEWVAKQTPPNAPANIVRKFKRLLFGSAEKVNVDNQGRILLSAKLRKLAGITRDVVFAGVGDYIELWDKKRWQDFEASESANFTETANQVSEYARTQGPSGSGSTS